MKAKNLLIGDSFSFYGGHSNIILKVLDISVNSPFYGFTPSREINAIDDTGSIHHLYVKDGENIILRDRPY